MKAKRAAAAFLIFFGLTGALRADTVVPRSELDQVLNVYAGVFSFCIAQTNQTKTVNQLRKKWTAQGVFMKSGTVGDRDIFSIVTDVCIIQVLGASMEKRFQANGMHLGKIDGLIHRGQKDFQ